MTHIVEQRQIDRLNAAKEDAMKFIERVDAAVNAISSDDYGKGKHIAAAKRTSMDLTRALALVRKSPYSV